MRGLRRAVRVRHLLRVAVVRRDEGVISFDLRGAQERADARVHGLDGPHGGHERARVPDHVAVGEVDDDEVHVRAKRLDGGLRDLVRAHLRRVVIRGDVLGALHHAALLAGEGLLFAAVEEIRHVRILLRLGDAHLREAGAAHDLAQRVGRALVGEGEREARRVLVARHRRDVDLGPLGDVERGDPGSASARLIWRARSGRKLKKIAASPSCMWRSRRMIAGSRNSSVTPALYECATYSATLRASRPRPCAMASYAFLIRSSVGRGPSRDIVLRRSR